MPGYFQKPGNVGVISRFWHTSPMRHGLAIKLRAVMANQLVSESAGDPIHGISHSRRGQLSNETDIRCDQLIGEIGGSAEEEAAEGSEQLQETGRSI